jgi:hypothetical protein
MATAVTSSIALGPIEIVDGAAPTRYQTLHASWLQPAANRQLRRRTLDRVQDIYVRSANPL